MEVKINKTVDLERIAKHVNVILGKKVKENNMNIVLEGPKASGKSTLAQHFISLGYEYFHSSSETENDLKYHLDLLKGDKRVIDRFSIGEMIYPSIYNREGKLSLPEFLTTMINKDTIYVILFASNINDLLERIELRDYGKKIDYESLRASNSCFKMMARNLKTINKNIKIFDISKTNIEDIIKEIEDELRNISKYK